MKIMPAAFIESPEPGVYLVRGRSSQSLSPVFGRALDLHLPFMVVNTNSRHIRCDEFSPVCRNCAKRGLTCKYPTSRRPLNEKGEAIPDLPWQTIPKTESTEWQPEVALQDAQPYAPSSDLSVRLPPSSFDLSMQDLRLMHHLLYVSGNLEKSNSSNLLTWTSQIPV